MENLIALPNIGKRLSQKLNFVEINSSEKLIELGSENALVRIATIEDSGVCLNMLFALEGAIQGIRWHHLDKERKEELKIFFKQLKKA